MKTLHEWIAKGVVSSEIAEKYGYTELVRCKDCAHRGNKNKCIVAFVADKQDFPVFFYDNRGKWFCADGKRRIDDD